MQTPGCIHEDHIGTLRQRRLYSIIYYGAGIGTHLASQNRDFQSFCPNLQLIHCSRSEGIRCHQKHMLSLVSKTTA